MLGATINNMTDNRFFNHPVIQSVLATEQSYSQLILRIALGIMIFPHGAQKLLGWYGGFGFDGTMFYFTDTLGIPYIFGLLAILAEFFGAFLLISGFLTRFAAFGVGMVMLTAALMVHLPHGFFMNWFGNQAGEGLEFFLLAIAMSLALVLQGGGRWSVDRSLMLANKRQ